MAKSDVRLFSHQRSKAQLMSIRSAVAHSAGVKGHLKRQSVTTRTHTTIFINKFKLQIHSNRAINVCIDRLSSQHRHARIKISEKSRESVPRPAKMARSTDKTSPRPRKLARSLDESIPRPKQKRRGQLT